MIIGIGLDIIEIARVQDGLLKGSERFLNKLFTVNEQRYCNTRVRPAQHFAVRFAAKEAIFKALGTGWRGKLKWTEIEICTHESGAPYPVFTGAVAEQVQQRAIQKWHLSLTHIDETAAAFVVAEGGSYES